VLLAIHRAENADRAVRRDLDVVCGDREQRLSYRAIESNPRQHLVDRLARDGTVEAPIAGKRLAVGEGVIREIAGHVDSGILQLLRDRLDVSTGGGFLGSRGCRRAGQRKQGAAGQNAATVNCHGVFPDTRMNSPQFAHIERVVSMKTRAAKLQG
jgi:hypothetical protein